MVRVNNRQIGPSPRHAEIEVNGWKFHFGRYFRARPLITSGRCRSSFSEREGVRLIDDGSGKSWVLPVDRQGRFLGIDKKPVTYDGKVVSIHGESGDRNAGVNFWHWVLGLNGSLPAVRRKTEDPQRFFRNFMRAVDNRAPFTQALIAKTNEQGAVFFKEGKRLIPCPADRMHSKTPSRETDLIFVPEWFLEQPLMFVFPSSSGGVLGELEFDPKQRLFFYEHDGLRVYFTALQARDNIYKAALLNYALRFGGKGRSENEVFGVTGKDGQLANLQPHLVRRGSNLKWKVIGGEAGVRMVQVGTPFLHRAAAVGITPKVKIMKDASSGRERYYIYFGRDGYYWISKEMQQKYGLKEGLVLEVEPLQGQVCALIDRSGSSSVRIPFILDWLWDGEKFALDHATASDLVAERMTGYRVLEQTATSPTSVGQKLCAGGMRQTLVGYIPGKTAPLPLCALVAEGKEVLFFVDRPRLSKRDWQVVELIVRTREGTLRTERKPEQASAKAKEAEALRKTAAANILEVNKLERAYILFIEAFCLDPTTDSEYLKSALELRNLIVLRGEHLERRAAYREKLAQVFSTPHQRPEDYARLLVQIIGGEEHNPTSTAYLLEALAILARRNPAFAAVFRSLPYAFDINPSVKWRLVGALRILYRDPKLSYLARWILSHPPAGKEALLRRRKGKVGMPAEDKLEIDWLAPKKAVRKRDGVKTAKGWALPHWRTVVEGKFRSVLDLRAVEIPVKITLPEAVEGLITYRLEPNGEDLIYIAIYSNGGILREYYWNKAAQKLEIPKGQTNEDTIEAVQFERRGRSAPDTFTAKAEKKRRRVVIDTKVREVRLPSLRIRAQLLRWDGISLARVSLGRALPFETAVSVAERFAGKTFLLERGRRGKLLRLTLKHGREIVKELYWDEAQGHLVKPEITERS